MKASLTSGSILRREPRSSFPPIFGITISLSTSFISFLYRSNTSNASLPFVAVSTP